MNWILALLFVGMPCLKAVAEEACVERDLEAAMGPVRDQSQTDWCFAYAAADLISQAVGFPVSAADTAVGFFLNSAEDLRRSDDPNIQGYLRRHDDYFTQLQDARSNAQESHAANRSRLFARLADQDGLWQMPELSSRRNFDPSDEPSFSSAYVATRQHGLIAAGGDVFNAVFLSNARDLCAAASFDPDDVELSRMLAQSEWLHQQQEASQRSCNGRVVTDDTSAVVDSRARSILDIFREQINLRCERRASPQRVLPGRMINDEYADVQSFDKHFAGHAAERARFQRTLLRKMDQLLNQNKAVAIDFSGYMLQEQWPGSTDPGDHTGIIAGRRKVGGQCFYILRNSWGGTCEGYRGKFSSRERCHGGRFYVTGEELMREGKILGLTYVK